MNRCRFQMLLIPLVLFAVVLNAQPLVTLSPLTQKYIRVNSPRVVLTHVRVIDGTGKPAVDDQNVVIEGGKILAVQPGADVASSTGATVLDLREYERLGAWQIVREGPLTRADLERVLERTPAS